MHFTKSSSLLGLCQSIAVLGAVHNVIVGQNNGLTFTPLTVNAQPGDQVKFIFQSQNHTVTSGNPNAGCTPSGQFHSGFVPVPAGTKLSNDKLPSFTVPVTNTNPVTVYCAQAVHCQRGMVMVINPSAQGATSLAAYQKISAAAPQNIVPNSGVVGGRLANLTGKCKGKGKKKAAKAAKKAAAGNAAGNAAGAAKAVGCKSKRGVNREVEDESVDEQDEE